MAAAAGPVPPGNAVSNAARHVVGADLTQRRGGRPDHGRVRRAKPRGQRLHRRRLPPLAE